ncbi:MAG: hypothetical protein JJU36_03055 [Phycisphaeraceae bacterium]|nr:hypothetical protein [Phycisphaeraceae bacterium]
MPNPALCQLRQWFTGRTGLFVALGISAFAIGAVNLPQPAAAPSSMSAQQPSPDMDYFEGMVVLSDGGELFGHVVAQTSEWLVIESEGRRLTIPRSEIDSIAWFIDERGATTDPASQFAQRRRAIDDGDYAARFQLAQWGYERGLLDLARVEVNDLTDVRNRIEDRELRERISLLARVVEARIRERDETARPRPDRPDGNGRAAAQPQTAPEEMLTDEQINLIRVYELRLFDFTVDPPRPLRPRLIIPRETIDRFLQAYRSEEEVPRSREEMNRFRRLPAHEQVQLFFRVRAREFYSQIQVVDDPPALLTWRSQIHPRYILNGCGTTECHGGMDEDGLPRGGFRVFHTTDARDLRTAYTNFYLVDRFENNTGLMIDRNRPADSLLVQYLLPREEARFPHPDVPQFRGRLPRNYENHREYRQLLEFIGNHLIVPRVGYGFTYVPPWERAEEEDEQPADGNDARPTPPTPRPPPPPVRPSSPAG